MLNVPIGNDLLAVHKRVRNIITVALKDEDHMLLRQLWCLLRNAEMKLPHRDNQGRLHKLRDWVALEMTELEIRQDAVEDDEDQQRACHCITGSSLWSTSLPSSSYPHRLKQTYGAAI